MAALGTGTNQYYIIRNLCNEPDVLYSEITCTLPTEKITHIVKHKHLEMTKTLLNGDSEKTRERGVWHYLRSAEMRKIQRGGYDRKEVIS